MSKGRGKDNANVVINRGRADDKGGMRGKQGGKGE